jgi:DNA-directed RNA polymerase specialized sigma24 family protein
VDTPDQGPADYAELLRIAEGTAFEICTPSAQSNHLAQQIAADALLQYEAALNSGEVIHNPHGWIKVTARRRAIDAIRKWQRDKKATQPFESGFGSDGAHVDWMRDQLFHVINDDPGDFIVEKIWIAELIDIAYPDDPINRDLAKACIVGGLRPRDVADEFGMTPKVVGNRLVRIRERLRDTLLSAEPE